VFAAENVRAATSRPDYRTLLVDMLVKPPCASWAPPKTCAQLSFTGITAASKFNGLTQRVLGSPLQVERFQLAHVYQLQVERFLVAVYQEENLFAAIRPRWVDMPMKSLGFLVIQLRPGGARGAIRGLLPGKKIQICIFFLLRLRA
jgi:hypothetical protein